MEGLLESVKMLVIYLENTKCVICYLKEENRWDSENFICTEVALEIKRMVDEKSGKDKERGQELFAFLGSMYLLRKILHFVLSNSGKALTDPDVAFFNQFYNIQDKKNVTKTSHTLEVHNISSSHTIFRNNIFYSFF